MAKAKKSFKTALQGASTAGKATEPSPALKFISSAEAKAQAEFEEACKRTGKTWQQLFDDVAKLILRKIAYERDAAKVFGVPFDPCEIWGEEVGKLVLQIIAEQEGKEPSKK